MHHVPRILTDKALCIAKDVKKFKEPLIFSMQYTLALMFIAFGGIYIAFCY